MHIKRFLKKGRAHLAILALGLFLLIPGRASASAIQVGFPQTVHGNAATVSVPAKVYLTGGMLQQMFQSEISQQIPQTVSSIIASMVKQLPAEDQGWASEMASSLLQPSATLVSITPQASGLLVTLKLSLYQGDPRPTTDSLLVGFSVSNASTIQVTALPINGKTGLVSGPLLTFHIPVGTLKTVSTITQCGDADLGVGLMFPLSTGTQNQTTSQTQSASSSVTLSDKQVNTSLAATANPPSYIELPASSLAQVGSSLGTMTISSSLTAQKIQVSTQGSNLLLNSDIHWHGLLIGTAVSTIAPGAANGNLVMHVTGTKLQILDNLISFPLNQYNQQIEKALNAELSGILKGTFTVTQAAVGPNAHLSCAASTSLLLGGTLVLG